MTAEKIQLEPDERILLQVRKHWFVLALQILSVLILAVLPFLLFGGLTIALGPSMHTFLPLEFLGPLSIGWLIIMWMVLFSVWTNYYLDVWTITNKRLVTVDQRGFFSRVTASFRLERLQDIIVNINGIIPTLLNYGILEIQTAGVEKNFKASGLPDPRNIKALILSSADILLANEKPGAQAGA